VAQSWKQRFTINPNTGGGGGGGGGPQPGTDLYDKLQEIIDRFTAGMIDADEATRMATAAINRMGEDAGLTANERKEEVKAGREFFETDDRTRLEEAYNDAIEKFTKGLITADEAVRRQQAAVNKFGESLGMTIEQRKQKLRDGFEDVRDEADASGQEGPSDPDNPINKLLGSVGGKFGIPPELTKMLAGSLGGGGGGLGKMLGGGGGGSGGLSGLLGGLGGGAGGLGGLASAAGPIGIAITAATAGAKLLEGFYKSVQETTKQMTAVATSIAGNDGIGAVTGAIEGASKQVTSKIPILGDALQAQVEMYTGFIKAFDQVTEAFKKRGEELKRFDSNIAGASANADVKKLLGDINEAQQLGNEYAAIIREKSELQAEFQRGLIPIKAAIMQSLIPLLKIANNELQTYNKVIKVVSEDMKRTADVVTELFKMTPSGAIVYEIGKNVQKMREKQEEEKRKKDQEMMRNLFELDSLADMMEDRDMRQQEQKPLGIDLFRS
jgi:hypothetical protein